MNGNGVTLPTDVFSSSVATRDEEPRARELARRYRCDFIDLREAHLQPELFRKIPVDLMFRYNFVPLEERDGPLWIAISDPSQLMIIDEISILLGKRIHTCVATLSQISDILKKTEQSQRVLKKPRRLHARPGPRRRERRREPSRSNG